MRFSRLIIRNFRSIGSEGVTIRFRADQNLASLVGSNGSGKSNVLEALGIVLGVYPFSRFEPEEDDFHDGDTNVELTIELHFDQPLVDRDVYQKEYHIHGFRYRGWKKTRGDGKGVISSEHYCFDGGGKTIVKPTRLHKRPDGTEEVAIDNSRRPVLVKDHAWKLGYGYVLDAPGLERFFSRATSASPLGRLFELYRTDFPGDHNRYEFGEGRSMRSQEAFERYSQRIAEVLRTPLLENIEAHLGRKIGTYLGNGESKPFQVGFLLPTHKDLFEKWIALRVCDQPDGPWFSVEKLGAGFRALLRVAVIETLLDQSDSDSKFILLIEEPETYLHVHLKRHFARVLRQIAERGHQIILTTHSPEFVDLARSHEVVRLHKQRGCSTVATQIPHDADFDSTRTKQRLRRKGNEELLFANHAVLVEGQDDKTVIEILLEAKGIDCDAHSVSVIDCDGKTQLPAYVGLCEHLGIDCYVVHDEDDPEAERKRNSHIQDAIERAQPEQPSLHRYKPHLEAALGMLKHCGLDKIRAGLEGKSYEQMAADYPHLIIPIDEFVVSRLLTPSLHQFSTEAGSAPIS